MDCLYKTKTINTFEEYKKFTWALLLKKRTIITFVIFEILFLFFAWTLESVFYLLFALLYPLLIWLLQCRQIKKIFKSNKVIQNEEVTFEFYDTYFTEEYPCGNSRLEYNKLYKIVETKTNFYLMIAKNQGYILVKDNFPEGLDEFLRNIKIS